MLVQHQFKILEHMVFELKDIFHSCKGIMLDSLNEFELTKKNVNLIIEVQYSNPHIKIKQ